MSERAQTMDEETTFAVRAAISPVWQSDTVYDVKEHLFALARTVQAIERERCAKVAHGHVTPSSEFPQGTWRHGYARGREEAASDIRRNPEPSRREGELIWQA